MTKLTAAALAAAVLLSACATAPRANGQTEPLHSSNGRVIGSVRQFNPQGVEFTRDANQDGKPEYHWTTKDDKMQVFERFYPVTGALRTRTLYLNGKVNNVTVYAPNGTVRGIVSYPDGVTAQSVELPSRGKTVEFVKR